MIVPDRLSSLREKLERGELVPADIEQAGQLVALDLAIMGREFAEQAMNADREADSVFESQSE